MKGRITILILCFISNLTYSYGQSNNLNESDIEQNIIEHEGIFIHTNTSLLLAGESLYYSVYCLNTGTNNLSALSKIAYVELIGEKHELIYRHKVKLKSGIGQGDFIIPVSVLSGNYKLVGYTQWMRNSGNSHFFKSDISIINPYSGSQQTILLDNENEQSHGIRDSIKNIQFDELGYNLDPKLSEYLNIAVSEKNAKKRSKVSIVLKQNGTTEHGGNYSISIRKLDAIDKLKTQTHNAESFNLEYKETIANPNMTLKDIVYLPELRGEIISGKLIATKDDVSVANKKISISIKGSDFILKVSNTNKDGVFYFNLNSDYDNGTAIFQVLDEKSNAYKIVLNEHIPVDYSGLEYAKLKVSSHYENAIVERSIYNQIENGYFSDKSSNLKNSGVNLPSFGSYHAVYNLDDFSRFSKVSETFTEIIGSVKIRRDSKQEPVFYVASLDPYNLIQYKAGVIVDGVLLQNYSKFLAYDSRKIKTISIARTDTKYIIGSQLFGGFVVVETEHGDFENELLKENNFKLFKPQPVKTYQQRMYNNVEASKTKRIPDFRNQLLWIPNIKMNGKETIVDFFTSDNTGQYEI